jgi:hypothetical protein
MLECVIRKSLYGDDIDCVELVCEDLRPAAVKAYRNTTAVA